MMALSPRIIGAKDVFKCYMSRLQEIGSVLEKAFVDFSARNGNAVQPLRSSTPVTKYNGLLLTMPAYSQTEDALVTKLVTFYSDNAAKGLPVIQASVLLFDSQTGSLNSMIDGNTLTALRTAHASAIATKHLASGFAVLSVLGAGTQAKSHIQIFSALFKCKEIRIWNHRMASAQKLQKEMEAEGINLKVFSSPEDMVNNADIIVTATTSTTPILKAKWIKHGAHINAVGACSPEWQELDEELMSNSTVYVDSKEAALVESGDIIKSNASVCAEIGDVIAGKVKPVPGETTLFKSLGMAIEDAVTANVVYKNYNANQC